jgi:hypothetical protein
MRGKCPVTLDEFKIFGSYVILCTPNIETMSQGQWQTIPLPSISIQGLNN